MLGPGRLPLMGPDTCLTLPPPLQPELRRHLTQVPVRAEPSLVPVRACLARVRDWNSKVV